MEGTNALHSFAAQLKSSTVLNIIIFFYFVMIVMDLYKIFVYAIGCRDWRSTVRMLDSLLFASHCIACRKDEDVLQPLGVGRGSHPVKYLYAYLR